MPQLVRGAERPDGDLPPVRDQHLAEHGGLLVARRCCGCAPCGIGRSRRERYRAALDRTRANRHPSGTKESAPPSSPGGDAAAFADGLRPRVRRAQAPAAAGVRVRRRVAGRPTAPPPRAGPRGVRTGAPCSWPADDRAPHGRRPVDRGRLLIGLASSRILVLMASPMLVVAGDRARGHRVAAAVAPAPRGRRGHRSAARPDPPRRLVRTWCGRAPATGSMRCAASTRPTSAIPMARAAAPRARRRHGAQHRAVRRRVRRGAGPRDRRVPPGPARRRRSSRPSTGPSGPGAPPARRPSASGSPGSPPPSGAPSSG